MLEEGKIEELKVVVRYMAMDVLEDSDLFMDEKTRGFCDPGNLVSKIYDLKMPEFLSIFVSICNPRYFTTSAANTDRCKPRVSFLYELVGCPVGECILNEIIRMNPLVVNQCILEGRMDVLPSLFNFYAINGSIGNFKDAMSRYMTSNGPPIYGPCPLYNYDLTDRATYKRVIDANILPLFSTGGRLAWYRRSLFSPSTTDESGVETVNQIEADREFPLNTLTHMFLEIRNSRVNQGNISTFDDLLVSFPEELGSGVGVTREFFALCNVALEEETASNPLFAVNDNGVLYFTKEPRASQWMDMAAVMVSLCFFLTGTQRMMLSPAIITGVFVEPCDISWEEHLRYICPKDFDNVFADILSYTPEELEEMDVYINEPTHEGCKFFDGVSNKTTSDYVNCQTRCLYFCGNERDIEAFQRGFLGHSHNTKVLLNVFTNKEITQMYSSPFNADESIQLHTWRNCISFQKGLSGQKQYKEFTRILSEDLTPEEQRQFISFCTGTDVISGCILIAKCGLDRLPSAATCIQKLYFPMDERTTAETIANHIRFIVDAMKTENSLFNIV